MPVILCFGDSNTWGTVPESTRRYGVEERWPALLRSSLPDSYELIEEGLSGRTTVHDDPFVEGRNGLQYLKPCLASHTPDLVIIMLGTNELKHHFGLSAYDISLGVARLVTETLAFKSPAKDAAPRVLLICPPPIYEVGYTAAMFSGGEAKSQELAKYYKICANDLGCAYFDAGSVVVSCEREGIHWQVEQHRRFADTLAVEVQTLFAHEQLTSQ